MNTQQRSESLRPYLLGLAVGQVVVGGALMATYLLNDNLALPVIGALVASWFWIPLAVANRHRPHVRRALRRLLVAVGIGLVKSLVLSGGAGAAVWMAIRRQLRTYTPFQLRAVPDPITRDTVVALRDLVRGSPRVDLHDITVRVVAYNLEKGRYTRGSGSNERTVSFSEPVRAVVLYEKELPMVRRGQAIEAALPDSFPFEPMFDALHPPSEVSPSHGMFVQWEVQLLHDLFVDHELIPPYCSYRENDFLYAARAEMEAARAG